MKSEVKAVRPSGPRSRDASRTKASPKIRKASPRYFSIQNFAGRYRYVFKDDRYVRYDVYNDTSDSPQALGGLSTRSPPQRLRRHVTSPSTSGARPRNLRNGIWRVILLLILDVKRCLERLHRVEKIHKSLRHGDSLEDCGWRSRQMAGNHQYAMLSIRIADAQYGKPCVRVL